jgi:predicted PurR-regulated permease PerM
VKETTMHLTSKAFRDGEAIPRQLVGVVTDRDTCMAAFIGERERSTASSIVLVATIVIVIVGIIYAAMTIARTVGH